ncbi:MAG: hypothetical protein U5J82_07925 [Desulfobacterales bacterium]|nr:hypothetical protein [Desulfobacterales bacterium]
MKALVTGRVPDAVRAGIAAVHQVEINPLNRPTPLDPPSGGDCRIF